MHNMKVLKRGKVKKITIIHTVYKRFEKKEELKRRMEFIIK